MSINQLNSRQDLEDLFKWLNVPLYKYVYIRCGYNRELAEDITQDIFVKAWEKRNTFHPSKSTLKNWIYIIARNHIIDTYRKKKISVKSFDEDIYVKDLDISIEDDGAVSNILRNLDRLKEKEKEVIILRYVQDLDIEDIAKILGKSKNTTKVTIHRAIKKLKYIMNN